MGINDLVFFVGTITLGWAPARMVYIHHTPPLSASLVCAIILSAFAINYIALGFLLAAGAQAIQCVLWAVLAYRARKATP